MEILWKGTISICGNCISPQNFDTRELGENAVFYVVLRRSLQSIFLEDSKRFEKTQDLDSLIQLRKSHLSFFISSHLKREKSGSQPYFLKFYKCINGYWRKGLSLRCEEDVFIYPHSCLRNNQNLCVNSDPISHQRS